MDAEDAPEGVPGAADDLPAGTDADPHTEASGTRKACETVSRTTRRSRKTVPTTEPSAGADKVGQPRGRGRPTKSDQSEAEIVEWWKPGWRE